MHAGEGKIILTKALTALVSIERHGVTDGDGFRANAKTDSEDRK